MRSSWTPLLEGSARTRALQLARSVVDAVAALPLEDVSHPGLLQGHAGYAVFFHHATGWWPIFAEQRDLCIERAVDAINAGFTRPTFQAGIGGIAWAVEHLGAGDEDFTAPMDEALIDFVRGYAPTKPWDLRSGLAGLGIYALERLPHPAGRALLFEVVDRLAERAEETNEGIRWQTRPEHILHGRDDPGGPRAFPDGFYDLGAAHGIPAVLTILAAAKAWDVQREQAEHLADGAFRWLMAQAASGGDGPRFGSYVHGRKTSRQGRFASCEGDPGAALCLWHAAELSQDAAQLGVARAMVREVARVALTVEPMQNSDLCCGTAGVAHIFNRLWQHSGEPLAREAARVWFDHTLARARPGEGIGGFCHPADARLADLQYGASGTALALLGAISDSEPTWDRALLYSVNTPAPAPV